MLGLDDDGEPLEGAEAPQSEETAAPSYSDKLFDHHLEITTNKISHVLASDKVSADAKEAFAPIVFEAGNEVGLGVDDPELVKVAFPKIIKSLDFEYGRGVYHSITSLLDSGLVEPIREELRQYEKRFDGKAEQTETEQKDVLDLSEVCMEFLQTKEATAGEKPVDLAVLLSAVMKHPNLPKKLYDLLSDEFCETPDDFSERPEVIQSSLKALRLEETDK